MNAQATTENILKLSGKMWRRLQKKVKSIIGFLIDEFFPLFPKLSIMSLFIVTILENIKWY